ncbi:tigger transposable element-derived protein 4-like [Dermacentor albipictus]|uniref:tigger transposable element-derived protein 4-like n=1 Tax=Dermacentor albipictus TaxID=60249 RepID=UPI0031FD59E2
MPKYYRTLTFCQKVCLIEEAEKWTSSKTQLAEKHKVPLSTLSTTLMNKTKIFKAYGKTHSTKRTRIRIPKYPDVEDALIKWLQHANAAHLPVNGMLLREKADKLALRLGHEAFKCSNGWLSRFKDRNNLTFVTVCGESGSVDPNVVENWKKDTLALLLQQCAEDDVYNMDEAALFYKMLPTKTFAPKDAVVTGKKQPKDRITVLFGANMSSSHKLLLLIIGKVEKPRCFKNARLPPKDDVLYRSNKKAWMTAALFEEYVRHLDRKFAAAGRKVVFVADNCPAHVDIQNLTAVRLVFLPPNVTAILRPMDQGVILQARKIYCCYLPKRNLLCYDNGKQYSVDLLGAICLIKYAWKQVEGDMIRRCFMHAGFSKQQDDSSEDASDANCTLDDEGESLCARMTDFNEENGDESNGLTFVEYLSTELDVQTSYANLEGEISDNGPSNEGEGDVEPTRAPALAAVVESLNVVRSFVECSGGNSELPRAL